MASVKSKMSEKFSLGCPNMPLVSLTCAARAFNSPMHIGELVLAEEKKAPVLSCTTNSSDDIFDDCASKSRHWSLKNHLLTIVLLWIEQNDPNFALDFTVSSDLVKNCTPHLITQASVEDFDCLMEFSRASLDLGEESTEVSTTPSLKRGFEISTGEKFGESTSTESPPKSKQCQPVTNSNFPIPKFDNNTLRIFWPLFNDVAFNEKQPLLPKNWLWTWPFKPFKLLAEVDEDDPIFEVAFEETLCDDVTNGAVLVEILEAESHYVIELIDNRNVNKQLTNEASNMTVLFHNDLNACIRAGVRSGFRKVVKKNVLKNVDNCHEVHPFFSPMEMGLGTTHDNVTKNVMKEHVDKNIPLEDSPGFILTLVERKVAKALPGFMLTLAEELVAKENLPGSASTLVEETKLPFAHGIEKVFGAAMKTIAGGSIFSLAHGA